MLSSFRRGFPPVLSFPTSALPMTCRWRFGVANPSPPLSRPSQQAQVAQHSKFSRFLSTKESSPVKNGSGSCSHAQAAQAAMPAFVLLSSLPLSFKFLQINNLVFSIPFMFSGCLASLPFQESSSPLVMTSDFLMLLRASHPLTSPHKRPRELRECASL